MNVNSRLSLAATVALCTAPFAAALNQDYYVHFGTYNGYSYVETHVTAVWSDGAPLVRPAGACGLRFEGFDETDWIFGGGFDMGPDFNVPDHEYIDVHLPSAGCGAWENLVVEPKSPGPGEPALVSPPGDFAGMLYVPCARAYWIDKNGDKLIYKHVCTDCSASGDFTYGNQGGAHEWMVVPEQLKTLTRVLRGTKDLRTPGVLFDLTKQSLEDLARELAGRVNLRRRFSTGNLEPALRALEDDATRNLNAAITRQLDCRAYRDRGDLKSAANACQSAVDAVALARGEITTAQDWIVH
jgi:hypothetical protein